MKKIDEKKKEIARKMVKTNEGYSTYMSPNKKGKGSLESVKSKTGKNENNNMMEGKNEHNRD